MPIAPVYDLAEALENPFLAEIGMIREVAHPFRGSMRVLSNPLRIGGARVPQVAAPALGEHTAQVRARLGRPPK